MSQTERAAFEDWWMLRGKTRPARSTEPGCADQYAMANAEMAWRGWKAARISASGGSQVSKGIKCESCCGLGTTDSHVMGEVCCSSCDGTGWEVLPVVDTTDELHQILGKALRKVPRP